MKEQLVLLKNQGYKELNLAISQRVKPFSQPLTPLSNVYSAKHFIRNSKYFNELSFNDSEKSSFIDTLFKDFTTFQAKGVKHYRDSVTKELYVIALTDAKSHNLFLFSDLANNNSLVSNVLNNRYANNSLHQKFASRSLLDSRFLSSKSQLNDLSLYSKNQGIELTAVEPALRKRELLVLIFYKALLHLVNELTVATSLDVSKYSVLGSSKVFTSVLRFVLRYSNGSVFSKTIRKQHLFLKIGENRKKRFRRFFSRRLTLIRRRRLVVIRRRTRNFLFKSARNQNRIIKSRILRAVRSLVRPYVSKIRFLKSQKNNPTSKLKLAYWCFKLNHVLKIISGNVGDLNYVLTKGEQNILLLVNKSRFLRTSVKVGLPKNKAQRFKAYRYLKRIAQFSSLLDSSKLTVFKAWKHFYKKVLYKFLRSRLKTVGLLREKKRRRRKFKAVRSFGGSSRNRNLVPSLFLHKLGFKLSMFQRTLRRFNYNFYSQLVGGKVSSFVVNYKLIYANFVWYNFYYWFLNSVFVRTYNYTKKRKLNNYIVFGLQKFGEGFVKKTQLGLKYMYLFYLKNSTYNKLALAGDSLLVLYTLVFVNKLKETIPALNDRLLLVLVYNYLFKVIALRNCSRDLAEGVNFSSVMLKFFSKLVFALVFINKNYRKESSISAKDLLVLDLVLRSSVKKTAR